MLLQVANTLKARDVRLVFADASDHVRQELELSGVTQQVGSDAFFDDVGDVLDRFRGDAGPELGERATPSGAVPPPQPQPPS